MNDKILTTIKKLLGIASDFTAFDTDILININSTFNVLAQLGVNESNKFIATNESVWSDYLTNDENLEMIKTYIYMKVKVIFDPPATSFVMDSYKQMISEYEWRINVAVESETL